MPTEFLLELLSEEIPARMQARAAAELRARVTAGLAAAGLAHGRAEAFVTPRRLALVIHGLPRRQPDRVIERKGPSADAPAKAIEGFLRSVGRARDELEERPTPRGAVLFSVQHVPGKAAEDVLAEVLAAALDTFPWPKSMRWGSGTRRWVRPLHHVLALLDGAPLSLPVAGQEAGSMTVGHRFLAPQRIEVANFDEYAAKLREGFVILDRGERRQAIEHGAESLARDAGLRLRRDERLLDELAGLAEWPTPLLGTIDSEFLSLPPEVLETTMRIHQRYLATETADGRIADKFVVVADNSPRDGGARIVSGNERVLRARLADARYFWDEDRRTPLASRAPALAGIVFHAKLGTLDAKADRMQALAVALCESVPGSGRDKVRSAARLAKADLVTGMVGEFPELQGAMGRYYALNDGENADVADAIAEHYAPRGPDDRCPTAPTSVVVALADKIDTLVGLWAVGEAPTGSKDPFALRRAALGVIRLVLENRLRVPLLRAFRLAAGQYSAQSTGGEDRFAGDEVGRGLLSFFADRLTVHLRERGVRHDLIAAVFALQGQDDLVDLLRRVDTLAAFLETDSGADLLAAYRRAANIVRIEQKKDGASHRGPVHADLLEAVDERALAAALEKARDALARNLDAEEYTAAMAALARLREPVDAFFERVTVNADDPKLRANRLRLLAQITATLEQVAQFSRIEG